VTCVRSPGRTARFLMLVLLLMAVGCGRREPQPSDSKSAAGTAEGTAAAASPAAEAAALDQGPRAAEAMEAVAPLAATGQMLFDAKGCTGCHTFGESDTAPDLRGVASRRTAAWLRRQILEPEWMAEHDSLTRAMVEHYGVPMADLDVSTDEAAALLHFLVREDAGP